jgi:hypothetical protein
MKGLVPALIEVTNWWRNEVFGMDIRKVNKEVWNLGGNWEYEKLPCNECSLSFVPKTQNFEKNKWEATSK